MRDQYLPPQVTQVASVKDLTLATGTGSTHRRLHNHWRWPIQSVSACSESLAQNSHLLRTNGILTRGPS